MSQTVTTRCATLRDGRRLSYVSIGPADGLLVLYLHGAIGSPQAICPELEAIVCDLRLRYVMVSRPGFGSSPPAAGRTLLGFARDAAALADGLGHERITVLGVSAGGPYALACAHELPERVAAAAVVSCLAPGTCGLPGRPAPARAALRALRTHPGACGRAGDAVVRIAQGHPRFVARVMRAAAAPADRRQLAGPEASEGASARFLAAAGGGVQGLIDDHLLCARPWGFGRRRSARSSTSGTGRRTGSCRWRTSCCSPQRCRGRASPWARTRAISSSTTTTAAARSSSRSPTPPVSPPRAGAGPPLRRPRARRAPSARCRRPGARGRARAHA